MPFTRPVSEQTYHIYSKTSCLPGDLNNECAEVSLCQIQLSFRRLSLKPVILTWWAFSPRGPEATYRGFPVSTMNAHYKTIFSLSLLYQLSELCLLTDLINEHVELSLPQCHWCSASSRLSCHQNFHINSKLCLLGDMNNKCGELRLPQYHLETTSSRSSCH